MSHTTPITLIANQTIELLGDQVNIRDLKSIELDEYGRAVWYETIDPCVLAAGLDELERLL